MPPQDLKDIPELVNVLGFQHLRKGCCHRIKCSAANFLVAIVWRRSLNSAALVTPTHRGLGRVSGGTSTQVVEMINKWGAKIFKRELYNVRDPLWRRDRKIKRETL